MQPNYNELAEKQQRDYQSSRDPFQYGQQVAQRRYSEMMSNLDNQRRATQQSYGDLYSQARQRAVGGAAAGGPTLSGGMGQQQRDYVSAIEMQELGRIGQAREGASRDLFSQGQAAFSNAQLEGQQATQMRLQDQQTQLQLVQQRQQILANTDLTDEQRAQQLAVLGDGSGANIKSGPRTYAQKFTQTATTGGLILGTSATALSVGKGAVAGVAAGKSAIAASAGVKVGSLALMKAGAGASTGILGSFGGAIGGALAAVPGWGWAALAALAIGSVVVAAIID
jgi:hypothetical protein